MSPFDIPLSELRRRRSAKWSRYPAGLLPGWVAEMDIRLADPISDALHQAISLSDTGYSGDPARAIEAFASFASDTWGWQVVPERTFVCADMAVAVTTLLRQLGGPVILNPPVYNCFFHWLPDAGQVPVLVPLRQGHLDLDGIGRALADGAKSVLLCHPHNPVGRVHEAAELAELATLADRYGAVVISDEIHAPLTYPGVDFVPFLTVSDAARRCGVSLQSASKAWNVAGLKCAFISTAPGGPEFELREDISWGAGVLGVIAAEVAYTECRDWLDELRAELAGRAVLLGELLSASLPTVGYQMPSFGYLAWLDCRALGLEGRVSDVFAARGGIGLSPGELFNDNEPGWVRLNFGTSPQILGELVDGMARSANG